MNVLHIVIVYVVLLVALAFFMSYSAIAKEKNRQLEEEIKNLKEKIKNLKEKNNARTSSKKMKPKDKHQSSETILFGSCPMCDCVVSSREKFCSKCGQKIDWGNEEVTQ